MPRTLSLKDVSAAIFDMDGTMINNMAYHKKAWYEFCARHNLEMTEDQFKQKISGKKNDQIFGLLFGKELSKDEIAQYADEKEAVYRELYEPDIVPIPGLLEIIQKLKDLNIKLAIATTAPKKNRDFALRVLGLEGVFPVILGDEHVTKGKPDPEIYLKTAAELKVEPSRCIAFEDSPPGVASAKNAGMKVVGILTTHTAADLNQADIFVKDFTELEVVT